MTTVATFNAAILLDRLIFLQETNYNEYLALTNYLLNNSIRDYRVSPDDNVNKGVCFNGLDLKLQYNLFECINFHQLFETTDEELLQSYKIRIYNSLAALYNNYGGETDDERPIIYKSSEYSDKLITFFPKLIQRCINIHMSSGGYNTKEEGVDMFWRKVDNSIFIIKSTMHINSLKNRIGNAD